MDRFLSAYEFAVETAARQEAPAAASPSVRSKSGNSNIGSTKAQTHNVWPWSLLVPFFASDIKRRVGDRRCRPMTKLMIFAGRVRPMTN